MVIGFTGPTVAFLIPALSGTVSGEMSLPVNMIFGVVPAPGMLYLVYVPILCARMLPALMSLVGTSLLTRIYMCLLIVNIVLCYLILAPMTSRDSGKVSLAGHSNGLQIMHPWDVHMRMFIAGGHLFTQIVTACVEQHSSSVSLVPPVVSYSPKGVPSSVPAGWAF